jgi:uncharacterized protein (TIGR01777 family)
MKILVTGATGFVGKPLVKRLRKLGHDIVVVTRNIEKAESILKDNEIDFFKWDAPYKDFPLQALEGVDAVINLMGENLAAKRWSDEQKKKLEDSRILGGQKLVEALNQKETKLKAFVQASAIGFYPINLDKALTENDGPADNYLSQLCVKWEAVTANLKHSERISIVRTGVVLGKNGGALEKMLLPFKMGVGGPIGNGKQMMSWIHLKDLISIFTFCATDSKAQGIYNAVSPFPVSNRDLSKALAKSLSRPCLFTVPPIALKMAMGEMSTIALDGQNIIPERLKNENFKFQFSDITKAFEDIVD